MLLPVPGIRLNDLWSSVGPAIQESYNLRQRRLTWGFFPVRILHRRR